MERAKEVLLKRWKKKIKQESMMIKGKSYTEIQKEKDQILQKRRSVERHYNGNLADTEEFKIFDWVATLDTHLISKVQQENIDLQNFMDQFSPESKKKRLRSHPSAIAHPEEAILLPSQ